MYNSIRNKGMFFIWFVGDTNSGAIAAGVIVALLAIALLIFALWYANKKGYLPSKLPWLQYVLVILYDIKNLAVH